MREWEAVIVGGGPAGLGAAIEIAQAGGQVLLIDENARAGGQLFKQIHKFFGSKAHSAGTRGFHIAQALLKQIEDLGVTVWLDSAVIGLFDGKVLQVRRNTSEGVTVTTVSAKTILLATGACENAIRFPGWTLPGVMGAGAAQTMINVNRVLPGKRVLMVGSGNVGLIVSYQLLQAGAKVLGIVEAADRIGGYGVHASKVKRAGVPYFLRHSVVSARGENNRLCAVTIAQLAPEGGFIPGTEQEFAADTLCLAVGLRPLTELAYLAGARQVFVPEMSGWLPSHNSDMMTTVSGLYVAGDVTGVEEANTALDEGRLAGVAMAHVLGHIDTNTMLEKKSEITARLHSLRQGPFGEKRAQAKGRILSYSDAHEEFAAQGSLFVKGKV